MRQMSSLLLAAATAFGVSAASVQTNAHIHLVDDKDANYRTISAALVSLRDVGFRLKLGYINANNPAK
jgi:hypothetical protein